MFSSKKQNLKGWEVISKKSKESLLINESEATETFTTVNGFSEKDKEEILSMKNGEEIDLFNFIVKCGFIKSYLLKEEN